MKSYAVIDIETRIDAHLVNATRFPGEGFSDAGALLLYRDELRTKHGSDFLPVLYHIPISIAVGLVEGYHLKEISMLAVGYGATVAEHEEWIVRHFWRLVDVGHTLVTWNGRGFDLPVLELAAFRYGIPAPKYWVGGTKGPRYRYSEEYHYDVADVLCNSGAVPRMRLGDMLILLGHAGKGEIDGSKVQQIWEDGRHEDIDAYCQRDVISTWAIWIKLEMIRGRMTPEQYAEVCRAGEPWLMSLGGSHEP